MKMLYALFLTLLLAGCGAADFSEQHVFGILKQNNDLALYIQQNPDYTLSIEQLNSTEIARRQTKAVDYKELYENLENVDGRYAAVKMRSPSTNRGFITLIDVSENKVLQYYGTVRFKMGSK